MGLLIKSAFVVVLVSIFAYGAINFYRLKMGNPTQKLEGFSALQRFKFQLANFLDFFALGRVHESVQKWESFGVWNSQFKSSIFVEVNETNFEGVPVVIYKPKRLEENSPSIVFLPGGQFWLGDLAIYHNVLLNLSQSLHLPIVAVNYRRSLQFPFPAAYDDAHTATQYYLQYGAKQIGADRNRVALMGDDSGAALTMSVSLTLQNVGNVSAIKFQILWNPLLQALDFGTPSIEKYGDDLQFNKLQLAEAWLLYLLGERSLVASSVLTKVLLSNDHVNAELLTKFIPNVDWTKLFSREEIKGYAKRVHPFKGNPFLSTRFTDAVKDIRFSPLSAASDDELLSLPPTYIIGCERDVVRDDAKMFVARMKKLSVVTYLHEYQNCSHFILKYFDLQQPTTFEALKDLRQFFDMNAML